MKDLEERMNKTIAALKHQFATVRTGRANPEILARVHVEYYGAMTPLQQVAHVSVPEPMVLMLNVFDRNAIKDVEKAILKSDLNLNPQVDGNIIRLRLPELTEDRRNEFVKNIKKYAEESKVALRNIRRDFLEKVKHQEKEKEVSEDDAKRKHELVQKEIDKYIEKIDGLTRDKEHEIIKI
ncbi:ribosome recycling factor [bacterium]|jgi:ribosome recycling factor|nr:ribosome recycling factor [bacterium]MBT3581430.1 ribosome recycling factor [bacterium]MBT4552530.1 ribosome recycling factor [bacterium]MBT5988673.1 ribosome recycling factor [bacterium]MBT7088131.1 ribosome recycling factor [bacterium]